MEYKFLPKTFETFSRRATDPLGTSQSHYYSYASGIIWLRYASGIIPLRLASGIIWLRSAKATASVRLATPSLDRILLTCDLIVDGLTPSLPAICVLFSPSVIRLRTSRSRSVRSRPGAGGWLAVWTRAWAASGESVARPACAAWMARTRSYAETSLSR